MIRLFGRLLLKYRKEIVFSFVMEVQIGRSVGYPVV